MDREFRSASCNCYLLRDRTQVGEWLAKFPFGDAFTESTSRGDLELSNGHLRSLSEHSGTRAATRTRSALAPNDRLPHRCEMTGRSRHWFAKPTRRGADRHGRGQKQIDPR